MNKIPITKKQREIEKQRIVNNLVASYSQQPGESNTEYHLFTLYKNLDRNRTYIKVTNLCQDRSYQSVCQMATKNSWKIRADDWDEDRDREIIIQLEDEILKNKLRQLNIGKQLQELAEKGSEMLLENIEELSPSDVVKMADTGTKLTNLALGSSTEITESKIEAEVKVKVEEIPKEIAAEIGKLIAIKHSEDTK